MYKLFLAKKQYNNKEKSYQKAARYTAYLYFVCFTARSGGNEKCSDEQFQCGNASGKCIPKRWQCDYHKDCENGEDEYDCRKYTHHPKSQKL